MATTRTQLLRKVYTFADGTTGQSAKEGWRKLTFELLAPQKVDDKFVVLETVELTPDMVPESIVYCAMGHGLSQKIGDDLAGIATKAQNDGAEEDAERGFVDYAKERIEAMLDNLSNGIWLTERESKGGSGGSFTIIMEALAAVFEKAGKPLTDEQKVAMAEKLKDADIREKTVARPDVNAEIARIKAERAAERAKKAQEKAADTDAGNLDDLLG